MIETNERLVKRYMQYKKPMTDYHHKDRNLFNRKANHTIFLNPFDGFQKYSALLKVEDPDLLPFFTRGMYVKKKQDASM